jgi:transcriptional regulator NrdR family protein
MAAKKKAAASKANWGANETPRHCRNQSCRSVNSEVGTVKRLFNPERTLRYRICRDCGQRFSTIEAGEKGATP